MEILFFYLFLTGIFTNYILLADASVSCFVCQSTADVPSGQCRFNVGETRKYKSECAPNITRCYAFMSSMNHVVRGCADVESDQVYQDCLSDPNAQPYCSICEGSLCNHWEAKHESELICSTCSPKYFAFRSEEDTSCAAGAEESVQCPLMAMQGRNVYCFTSFNVTNGKVVEKGCTDDLNKSNGAANDRFTWTCDKDQCNLAPRLDFSCVSFSGYSIKFNQRKKTMRCNLNRKTFISGCYVIFKDARVEMGCNSELTVEEFRFHQESRNSAQFCYSKDCNERIVLQPNKCKRMKEEKVEIDLEICKDLSTRCFIRKSPKAPNGFVSGCVKTTMFPYADPETRFCKNNQSTPFHPCNDIQHFPLFKSLSCHKCVGPRCRQGLGNVFKTTCPAEATACYTAEGYDKAIERGCWVPGKDGHSDLCDLHPDWCYSCTENNCNDALAGDYLRSCSSTRNVEPCRDDYEDPYTEGLVYEGYEEDLTPTSRSFPMTKDAKKASWASKEDFFCYQCHSDNFYQQSCDEDVRFLEPTACPYLYGSRPSSCYILIHRGYKALSRGCGTELDKYTYSACDSNLFPECTICAESGCNDQDMKHVLFKDKERGTKKQFVPNYP